MRTTLYFPAILLLLLALAFGACEKGNGVLVTQTFEIEDFDKINLLRHADVYITQGPTRSVTIEVEENLADLIKTEVVDGEWTIDFRKTVKEYLTMTIYITMPEVNALRLTEGSGGDIFLENILQADDLVLELRGDGTINGEVAVANTLTTSLAGSGNISISGTAATHVVNNTGAGTISAYYLVANNGSATVSGSGNAQVHYTGAWQADISGSGNIMYMGAAPANSNITGSGTVQMVP